MKLSIIVPCYNAEGTISRCVDSLMNCTYNDKEILLIDDGSTDHTKSIIDDYAKKYNNCYAFSKKNEGLGKTRNYGIKICKGEYITFIDSDDCIQTEAYEDMLANLRLCGADVVYCGFKYIFSNYEKTDVFDCKRIYDNTDDFIKYVLDENRCFAGQSVCTGIYKKRIIDSFSEGPFLSEREYLSEDKLFNVMYLQKSSKAVIVNKSYYYYYQHQFGSISTTFKEYKINAAYNMCKKLLALNHSENLTQFICIDFLVNLSACFYQICLDKNIKYNEKIKYIKGIVKNTIFIDRIKMINVRTIKMKFKILYFLIRLKMSRIIYFLYTNKCRY